MSGVFGKNETPYKAQTEGVATNLGNVASTASNFGQKESKQGFKSLKDVMAYLKPLVSGDRTAMSAALGPELRTIGDQYDAAAKNTAEFGPRGSGQAGALAGINTAKAGAIGDTYLKARPMAANALTNIGSILTGAGTANNQVAAGAYGSQGNQYANLAKLIQEEQARRSAAWGDLFKGIGSVAGGFLGGMSFGGGGGSPYTADTGGT